MGIALGVPGSGGGITDSTHDASGDYRWRAHRCSGCAVGVIILCSSSVLWPLIQVQLCPKLRNEKKRDQNSQSGQSPSSRPNFGPRRNWNEITVQVQCEHIRYVLVWEIQSRLLGNSCFNRYPRIGAMYPPSKTTNFETWVWCGAVDLVN